MAWRMLVAFWKILHVLVHSIENNTHFCLIRRQCQLSIVVHHTCSFTPKDVPRGISYITTIYSICLQEKILFKHLWLNGTDRWWLCIETIIFINMLVARFQYLLDYFMISLNPVSLYQNPPQSFHIQPHYHHYNIAFLSLITLPTYKQ